MADDAGTPDYEHQTPRQQAAALKRAAIASEWDVPDGRIGQLVRQLRHRGRTAMRQRSWLLIALIFATFVGLVFYLGLPFFRIAVDGRRDALNTTVEAIIAQNAALDADRARIVSDIALTLENVPRLVPTGTQNDLTGHIELSDSTLIYGEDGVIIRSTDGGETFAPVASGVDESFTGHVVIDNTILIYGEDGVLSRSTDGGASFERVRHPIDGDFDGHVLRGKYLLLYSQLGGILRSDDGGDTFARLTPRQGFLPREHLQLSDTDIIIGGDFAAVFDPALSQPDYINLPDWRGFYQYLVIDNSVFAWRNASPLYRLSESDAAFIPVAEADPNAHWRGLKSEANTILYGETSLSSPVNDDITLVQPDGTIVIVSTDGGQSFTGRTHRFSQQFFSHFEIGTRLFLISTDGARAVSDDNGLTFTTQDFVDDFFYVDQFESGGAVYLYGDPFFLAGGQQPQSTLLRTTDGGETFEVVFKTAGSIRHAETESGVLLYGQNGAISRLADTDQGVFPIHTGLPHDLYGHVTYDNQAFIYGDEGTVIDTTPGRASAEWRNIFPANGVQGDTQIRALLSLLQPQAQTAIANSEREFNALLAKRSTLVALQSETDADLQELTNLPYSLLLLKRQRESFAGFMATCRGVTDWSDPPRPRGVTDADPDAITLACLQGWQTQSAADTDTWWATIAAQVPPGVLLLFLLATFGGLYRYNLRLAVFHNSRADALELLAAQQSDGTTADLAALSEALAADKVEFSKASLPTDQVVSLANTLIGKIRP
jgi:photosystem II stability/assembly factor-like uncharacterized protein